MGSYGACGIWKGYCRPVPHLLHYAHPISCPSCDYFGLTISRPNGESPFPGSVNSASSSVPSAPSTARPPLGRPHWVRAICGCWSHQVGRGGSACSPSCPLPHLHTAQVPSVTAGEPCLGFLVVSRRAALAMRNRCTGPVQQGAVLRWAGAAESGASPTQQGSSLQHQESH
jgi:hypothetical protein